MKSKSNLGTTLELAGLAVAGIAGAYFLYGKNGAKNRKKIHAWTLRAKAEVLEQLEKAKDINQGNFQEIVDKVVEKYSKSAKGATPAEIMQFAKDLKKHWSAIKSELTPKTKKTTKKTAKK